MCMCTYLRKKESGRRAAGAELWEQELESIEHLKFKVPGKDPSCLCLSSLAIYELELSIKIRIDHYIESMRSESSLGKYVGFSLEK